MSGLAVMLAERGCLVSGSDRAIGGVGDDPVLDALRAGGLKLYPQDGSFVAGGLPDALVYSTAIEDDNPDFLAAEEVPRLHRSAALSAAISSLGSGVSVGVAGSCGKTTVTSWLAETLHHLGMEPGMLSGGAANLFRSPVAVGNYHPGAGPFVFEADESDKSLIAYHPDISLILNTGTDHYPMSELIEVFRRFAANTSRTIVTGNDLADELRGAVGRGVGLITFDQAVKGEIDTDWRLSAYRVSNCRAEIEINGEWRMSLPMPGIHNAANALAVVAAAVSLGASPSDAVAAAESFSGVWRRFDFAGTNSAGFAVYDDYAHNVEKIVSCYLAAREIAGERVFVIFQPHGFGPLGFMRDVLFEALEAVLAPGDFFAMLPVFYAGGTSSFTPSSEEVIAGYAESGGGKYAYFADRSAVQAWLAAESAGEGDAVVVMGARDNSLSAWAAKLADGLEFNRNIS